MCPQISDAVIIVACQHIFPLYFVSLFLRFSPPLLVFLSQSISMDTMQLLLSSSVRRGLPC